MKVTGFFFECAFAGANAGKRGMRMTSQEIAIYREIQRNTENAMKAIDTISDKVYDEALSMQLSRQSIKYSELHNAASKRLVDGKADYFRSTPLADAMLRTGIHYNTLLNTSTSHIAEVLIKGCTSGILEMEKALKRNADAGEQPITMAKQLIETQERHVARLKQYL